MRTASRLTAVLIAAAAIIFFVKVKEDFNTSRYRANYVVRFVEHHLLGLSRSIFPESREPLIQAHAHLLRGALTGTPPLALLSKLDETLRGARITEDQQTLVKRWQADLNVWARDNASNSGLASARRDYALAAGYGGAPSPAAVLLLRAAIGARRELLAKPEEPNAPEALYLLADSLRRLRLRAREGERPDALMHLCAEQYPGTVWGSLASSIAQFALGGS